MASDRHGDQILYYGSKNFEVARMRLENLCTPGLSHAFDFVSTRREDDVLICMILNFRQIYRIFSNLIRSRI